MALTLPIEEMSRLKVSFKVFLPDGGFSFDMAPSPTPCSTRLSGLKLNFQGQHDETGGVTFTVWASDLPDTSNGSAGGIHHREFPNPYLGVDDASSGSINPDPSLLPSLPANTDFSTESVSSDDMHVDATLSPTSRPSIYNTSEPDMAQFFDNQDAFAIQWTELGLFVDEHPESGLFQPEASSNSVSTCASDTTSASDTVAFALTSKAPSKDQPGGSPDPVSSLPPFLPAYDSPISFLSIMSSDNVDRSAESVNHSEAEQSAASPQSSSPDSPSELYPSFPIDPSRPYKCLNRSCPLWFKRLYTRQVHMGTHLPSSEKKRRYPCSSEGCSMKFTRKHDLLRHTVGSHKMGTDWHCQPCHKFFSSQTTLERHRLDNHMPQSF